VKTTIFCATQAVNLQGVISKLQLAAAMPPPARKRIIFKDNNHVVLEVLFGPSIFGFKRAKESRQGALLCPLSLAPDVKEPAMKTFWVSELRV
jgi:hypothetical protein